MLKCKKRIERRGFGPDPPLKRISSKVSSFFKSADMLLLALCCIATIYGIVAVSSATAYRSNASRFVIIQTVAFALGIGAYVIFSLIDIDIIAEQSRLLYIFSLLFIFMLKFWGVEADTGNRAWMQVPYIGISIQPAELCKVLFIIVLAKSMSVRRDKISAPGSVFLFAFEVILIGLLIVAVSYDAGSAIVYFAIFAVMALAAGISLGWFLGGFAALAGVIPIIWNSGFMREDQKNRIMVIFDNTIDPLGSDVRYQMKYTKTALGSGKLFGQGYGQGVMTQSGVIPAQHTDCIFASIGEELGYVGCMLVLLILLLIVIRCIYVGVKTAKYSNRLICVGIAGMLMFQIIINIGMVIGVLPVIGLTLPFFSYGGSSIVTSFAAMGIVSGIKMRPESDSTVQYIKPPVGMS